MSDVLDQTLAQYRELCARLDAKFAEIRAARPASFACRLGCHSCCKPALTVNELEREVLERYLAGRPELLRELRALRTANPHGGKRCAFLGADGACAVYEARPLVCRSHGAPLQYKPEGDEETRVRDACPLNFKGEDLAQLPAEHVLNLDTLNTLLALLAQRAFPGCDERYPLASLLRDK